MAVVSALWRLWANLRLQHFKLVDQSLQQVLRTEKLMCLPALMKNLFEHSTREVDPCNVYVDNYTEITDYNYIEIIDYDNYSLTC